MLQGYGGGVGGDTVVTLAAKGLCSRALNILEISVVCLLKLTREKVVHFSQGLVLAPVFTTCK